MRVAGFVLAAWLSLAACIAEQQTAHPGPPDGSSAAEDAAVDAALPDGGGAAPDSGSPDAGAGPVDSGVSPPDGGAGEDAGGDGADGAATVDAGPPPCPPACAHLAACSLQECPGVDAAVARRLEDRCLQACPDNASLATVLDPGRPCEDVVAFGRLWAGEDYQSRCRRRDQPIPDGGPCPWACVAEEVCTGARCVRPDGTCVTDYHCFVGREQCSEGRCQPAQFAPCFDDSECVPELQQCRATSAAPGAPGACFINCEADAHCPLNEACQLELGGICYYALCGGAAGNGEAYGGCTVAGSVGVCYPLAQGDLQPGGPAGICLEGGAAPLGAPCDSQALGRTEHDVTLRCAEGLVCFGDPDQPLDPVASQDGTGGCAQLCDPRAPACPDAQGWACLDLSAPDDPRTPGYDETRPLGICVLSECGFLEPGGACPDEQVCEPYTPVAAFGRCRQAGPLALGEPCAGVDDCADAAVCGDNGRGAMVCIAVCDPAAPDDCRPGETCWSQPGWVLGFCVGL